MALSSHAQMRIIGLELSNSRMKKHFIFVFFGIFLALVAVSCGDSGAEGTKIAVIDTTRIDTADPNVKIKRLTESLKLGPTNWNLWYERSLLLYEIGNTEGALADANKAVEYSITEASAYHLRGFIYYAKHSDSAAMRDFQRASELDSQNPETYYHIGQLYFLQQQFEKADEAYDYAIKLDSMQPTYYFAKGYLRLQQKDVEAAIQQYDLALKRDPTFIKALLGLHDIFLNQKKNADQAYIFNERVLLVDSTQPVAHFNQGNFFIVRANKVTDDKKMQEFQVLLKIALSEFNLCLKYDPKFVQAIYNRGYVYFLLANDALALQDFSKVIEMDPFNEKAFFMKASIQEGQKDLVSALENYKRAVEIDPGFRDAAQAVKELTAQLGKQK